MSEHIATRADQPGIGPGYLLILNYHAVIATAPEISDWCFLDAGAFREQLRYLRQHYDVLALGVAAKRLAQGDITRPTVCITFDDGYQNNYDVAYPILQAEKLPATIFIVTGLVNTDNTLWYCRLLHALSNTARGELMWQGSVFDLGTRKRKEKASRILQQRLKLLTPGKLQHELENIVRSLGDNPDNPLPPDSPYRMLSAQSIHAMVEEGLVEFGAHTHGHAILSLLTREEQRLEIETSIQCTQAYTKQDCRLFAYPNGRYQDFNATSLDILRDCGIATAVTVAEGINNRETPGLQLLRHGIGAGCGMAEFQAMLQQY